MRGRKPYIPHRGDRVHVRLWEPRDDDWPVFIVTDGQSRTHVRPSYLDVRIEMDGWYHVYEDPEEECLVIESDDGAHYGLDDLDALIGSRSVACECGSTFSIHQALEHAAAEKHGNLKVR